MAGTNKLNDEIRKLELDLVAEAMREMDGDKMRVAAALGIYIPRLNRILKEIKERGNEKS